MAHKRIELPVYMILVQFDTEAPGAGSICSDVGLYETCPSCGQQNCLYQCDDSHLGEVEPEEDVVGRIKCNAGIDTILSLVLAHACAGIDIESPAYLEGIETAFDALSNNT